MQIDCKGVALNKEFPSQPVNPGRDVAVYPVRCTLAHSGDGLYFCSLSASYAAVGTCWTCNTLTGCQGQDMMWVSLAPGGIRSTSDVKLRQG